MEKKIVGLNTYFKSLEYENFDEYEFSARISLLDYDAVVINAEYLITCYSTSYDSSYQNKRKRQILRLPLNLMPLL